MPQGNRSVEGNTTVWGAISKNLMPRLDLLLLISLSPSQPGIGERHLLWKLGALTATEVTGLGARINILLP